MATILTNPPEGDRSGGGAGLGLGGVKEKLRQKRDEERVGPRGDRISKAPSEVVPAEVVGRSLNALIRSNRATQKMNIAGLGPRSKFCSKRTRKNQSRSLVHSSNVPLSHNEFSTWS